MDSKEKHIGHRQLAPDRMRLTLYGYQNLDSIVQSNFELKTVIQVEK